MLKAFSSNISEIGMAIMKKKKSPLMETVVTHLVRVQMTQLQTCAFTLRFRNARHRPDNMTFSSRVVPLSTPLHFSKSTVERRHVMSRAVVVWATASVKYFSTATRCHVLHSSLRLPSNLNTSRDKWRLRNAYSDNLPPSATWSMHAAQLTHMYRNCAICHCSCRLSFSSYCSSQNALLSCPVRNMTLRKTGHTCSLANCAFSANRYCVSFLDKSLFTGASLYLRRSALRTLTCVFVTQTPRRRWWHPPGAAWTRRFSGVIVCQEMAPQVWFLGNCRYPLCPGGLSWECSSSKWFGQ